MSFYEFPDISWKYQVKDKDFERIFTSLVDWSRQQVHINHCYILIAIAISYIH